jgi:hypothetical protein
MIRTGQVRRLPQALSHPRDGTQLDLPGRCRSHRAAVPLALAGALVT